MFKNRPIYLKIALLVTGLIFIFAIYPLTVLWPSGWSWHAEGPSMYLQMILGIYVTLGIFLIIASKNPPAHLSLIWFTICSCIVHSIIMAIQSFIYPGNMRHLFGDVPALLLIALVLIILIPKSNPQVPK